jgi:hypothetical protein
MISEVQNIQDITITQFKHTKKIYEDYKQRFITKYLLDGKSIQEWENYFRVNIPKDVNTRTCILYANEVMTKFNIATMYKREAEASLLVCKTAYQEQYRIEYAKLIESYTSENKKTPAKDTIVTLVENKLNDLSGTINHAEIALSFWKDIINNLSNARKTIEHIIICLSVEAKAMGSEKYLDKLEQSTNQDEWNF